MIAIEPRVLRLGSRSVACLVFACVALGARPARADNDAAAAQALFDEAKALTAAGKYEEACPKFLASLKLDQKPGAAINLADCYEKSGKLASAWARYVEAATLAERVHQADRQQYAKDHASVLEPLLSRLTIAVAAPVSGMQVRRDGEPIDAAVLGSALPVDAGQHVIEVTAPGKKPWSSTVTVAAGAAQVKIDVPTLEDAPPEAGPAAPSGPSGLGAQRIAGIALASVGLAGVVVGAAFGGIAASKWSGVLATHCHNSPTMCDPTGIALAGDAKQAATISTVGFVAGGVVLATGVVVFFTAPRQQASPPPVTGLFVAPKVAPGWAMLSAGGTF
jgi:hypothetical protein